ncbi:MAG: zinc ABC transporter substrate-binding protein [Candidatus Dormibacteria bacterium]|jgi:zinc/manganese transport system substrate-binding protein
MGKLLTRRAGSRGLGSVTLVAVAMLAGAVAAACAPGSASDPGRIAAVGAESEYANVITQIGGPYVAVSAVMSNPNIDPHTYEASPQVAQTVSTAQLVVQNGAGYDGFMETIEVATPSSTRRVIDVQSLLGLPATTENPHLWYSPATMPAVAKAIGKDLAALAPSHEAYFTAEVAAFDTSLAPWTQAIAALKSSSSGAPVATTEPVADYMLQAAGLDNLTPWPFQADVMNGVDPSAQDVSLEQGFFTGHQVKAFIYNQQVTDSLTQSLLTIAHENGIPVVGVYETMPTPGYDYQTWMVAEVNAVQKALASGVSTTRL